MSCRAAAIIIGLLVVAGCGSEDSPEPAGAQRVASAEQCEPTPEDALGPFYRPDAPVRNKVGEGYALSGTVRYADDCEPIPHMLFLEFWLVGPDGEYDDAHRATVVTRDGRYRFESNVPVAYEGRPPHIHILVTLPNDSIFVTQHYPEEGDEKAQFDIVLPSEEIEAPAAP